MQVSPFKFLYSHTKRHLILINKMPFLNLAEKGGFEPPPGLPLLTV